ncbi:MAG: hypothetical protein ACREPT_15005, partial [Rudaea sp.]
EQDKRRPSSLGPRVWYQWIQLAYLQAQVGDSAAAAQALKDFARDTGEFVAQLSPADPKRQLLATPEQSVGTDVQLIEGASQAALTNAIAVVDRIGSIEMPAGDLGSTSMKNRIVSANLAVAAQAAIRLGRYAQAEALARRWLAVPPDPQSEADPRDRASRANAALTHAIAMQGRTDDARKTLQPALDYYRQEQQAGAHGTLFRGNFAYALYVSALTCAADAAGRAQRDADLTEASKLIDGASTQAQQLADMREVAGLIAAARAAPHG